MLKCYRTIREGEDMTLISNQETVRHTNKETELPSIFINSRAGSVNCTVQNSIQLRAR